VGLLGIDLLEPFEELVFVTSSGCYHAICQFQERESDDILDYLIRPAFERGSLF
jgi:hypothetical protein